jgi:hypothetical protein
MSSAPIRPLSDRRTVGHYDVRNHNRAKFTRHVGAHYGITRVYLRNSPKRMAR